MVLGFAGGSLEAPLVLVLEEKVPPAVAGVPELTVVVVAPVDAADWGVTIVGRGAARAARICW